LEYSNNPERFEVEAQQRWPVAGANPAAMLGEQELTPVATVVEPDIEADNGVIHGIDSVLLPPEALRSF
jgi:uncharacterized surface protein with fasciclin (FAS1) repeats